MEYGLTLHTEMSRSLYHYLGSPQFHRRRMVKALLVPGICRIRTASNLHAPLRRKVKGAGAIQPLSDLRVVEWAQGVAGAVCSRALADLGADVIKVEPPEGDPARFAGPFPNDQPHIEKSGRFL